MNAREKLETEVAAGVFEDLAKDNPLGAEQQYYAKLASLPEGWILTGYRNRYRPLSITNTA